MSLLGDIQSIETMETVWRWENPHDNYYLKESGNADCPYSIWIKEKITSWAGFGKTLEAMAERGYFPEFIPSIDKRTEGDRYERMDVRFIKPARSELEGVESGVAGFQFPDNMVESVPRFTNYLWQATHVAALEAIKEKNVAPKI